MSSFLSMSNLSQVLALLVIVVGAIVMTFSLTKNRGFEAQKQALESWRANAEAKDEDLKHEREKNEALHKQVDEANRRIANLEAEIIALKARPDLTAIIQALTGQNTAQEEGRNKAVAIIVARIEEQCRMAQEFHKLEITALEKIIECLDNMNAK